MTSTPTLHTIRLDLTPLRVGDADEMAAVLADPAVYAFTGGEAPNGETLRERFARLVVGRSPDGLDAWHNWIVRLATDGTAVGTVQATVSGEGAKAEIAWIVGIPWQGLGYASEAALALVAWLESVGTATIIAHIHPAHRALEAVAKRAGLLPTDEIEDGERVWRLRRDSRSGDYGP